jgi:hypothetical protein
MYRRACGSPPRASESANPARFMRRLCGAIACGVTHRYRISRSARFAKNQAQKAEMPHGFEDRAGHRPGLSSIVDFAVF